MKLAASNARSFSVLAAFLLPSFLSSCRQGAPPAPEPSPAKREARAATDFAAATVALPSSSLIAVTGNGVTAFSPSGALAWTYKLPATDNLVTTPAPAPNSYLYLRGAKTIYAVGPDGQQVWAADIDGSRGTFPSLVVLTDSSVAAVIGDATLACLTTTGTMRWNFTLPDGAKLSGAPSSAPNGFVVLRTRERIYALNSDGILQWSTVVPPA